MYGILRHMDAELLKDYGLDKFEAERGPLPDFVPEEHVKVEPPVIREIGLPSVQFLPPGHVAREFLASRRIPEHRWKDFYHAEDYATWANSLVPGKYSTPGDSRLVIPFWSRTGTLVGFQGRAYDPASPVRYLTASLGRDEPFLYGLDRATVGDRLVAVEGPLDSEFIRNGIASAGGSIIREIENLEEDHASLAEQLLPDGPGRGSEPGEQACYPTEDTRSGRQEDKEEAEGPERIFTGRASWGDVVVAYDNEPRSAITVRKIQKAIEAGFSVFIWPEGVVEKDFNDLVMQMMKMGSPLELALSRIDQMITERTFTGLEAELELMFWKKV